MENFMKMQEEKKKQEESNAVSTPAPKPLFSSLVKKKPLIMKMRGFKKAPTLLKSVKTLSALEGNDSDNAHEDTQQGKAKGDQLSPNSSSICSTICSVIMGM